MKRMFFGMLVGLSLLAISCSVKKPVLPEWDVTVNVPLMQKKFFVSDLVDSVNIIIGDDDLLTLRGTGSAETPLFGDVELSSDFELGPVPILSQVTVNGTVPLNDTSGNVRLAFGRFTNGVIGVRFTDMHPQGQNVKLSFPDIRTSSGAVFEIGYNGSSGWENHSLEGCEIGTLNSSVLLNELRYTITPNSQLPQNFELGELSVRMNTPFAFELFQGHLDNMQLPLEDSASTISIDYPNNIEDAIQLQTARLYVSLTNQVGFECEFHGDFYARNSRTNETRTIPILDNAGNPYIANPATSAGPGITELVFENSIEQLLQIMPDEIEIRNAFFLINSSSTGYIGTVRNTDIIVGEYQIDAPFVFELLESTIRLQDPIQINISEENRTRILNNARDAALSVLVKNRVPVGATANMYVGGSAEIDPANPDTWHFHRSVTLHSSQYVEQHPNDPDINALGEQMISLALSEAEVDIFANPSVYLLWTFSFENSNGVVQITASPADYIQIRSMITAGLHISGDK